MSCPRQGHRCKGGVRERALRPEEYGHGALPKHARPSPCAPLLGYQRPSPRLDTGRALGPLTGVPPGAYDRFRSPAPGLLSPQSARSWTRSRRAVRSRSTRPERLRPAGLSSLCFQGTADLSCRCTVLTHGWVSPAHACLDHPQRPQPGSLGRPSTLTVVEDARTPRSPSILGMVVRPRRTTTCARSAIRAMFSTGPCLSLHSYGSLDIPADRPFGRTAQHRFADLS